MNTDFPTVDFYFVFAFTYCHLRVYKEEEEFARKVLKSARVEFLKGNESPSGYDEVDTRLFTRLINDYLNKKLSPLKELI